MLVLLIAERTFPTTVATTTFQEFSLYGSNERSTAFIANTPSYYDPNQNNDRNLYKSVSGPEGRTLHFSHFQKLLSSFE